MTLNLLNSVSAWLTDPAVNGHEDVIQALKTCPLTSLKDCRQNPGSRALLRLYAERDHSSENLDLLDAVDEFRRAPSVDGARTIYDRYVSTATQSVEINIGDEVRRNCALGFEAYRAPGTADIFESAYQEVCGGEGGKRDMEFQGAVDAWRQAGRDLKQAQVICEDYVKDTASDRVYLKDETRTELIRVARASTTPDRSDFFDEACGAVEVMVMADTWHRFHPLIADVQKELNRAEAPPPPPLVEAEADSWNRAALKALGERQGTVLYETDHLFVIESQHAMDAPKYLRWARQYARPEGMISVTVKGGAFDPGSVRVDGLDGDLEDELREALGRISKKRVEFTAS